MNGNFVWPGQPESKRVQPPMVYIREDPVWEYKPIIPKLDEEKVPSEKELNSLDAEGWELVESLQWMGKNDLRPS
jgi:hypothetical protein